MKNKNNTKNVEAQVITLAAIDYIVKGELADCYNIIYSTYGLTAEQIDKILDKYNNVLDELVDQYQNILVNWVADRL